MIWADIYIRINNILANVLEQFTYYMHTHTHTTLKWHVICHLFTVCTKKQISIGYRTDRKNPQKIISNIDPKPRRFTELEDPTRYIIISTLQQINCILQ